MNSIYTLSCLTRHFIPKDFFQTASMLQEPSPKEPGPLLSYLNIHSPGKRRHRQLFRTVIIRFNFVRLPFHGENNLSYGWIMGVVKVKCRLSLTEITYMGYLVVKIHLYLKRYLTYSRYDMCLAHSFMYLIIGNEGQMSCPSPHQRIMHALI